LLRCAKAAGVKATPKDLTERRKWWGVRQFDERRDAVHIAVASYYRKMEANRALDFNAILTRAFEHLSKPTTGGVAVPKPWDNAVVLTDDAPLSTEKAYEMAYQRRWKHLLVDEFQDATRADFQIYMVISAENRFFVGDPDQGIFGWRGGDITGIMSIAESPDWETILLEGNFRSGANICAVAQRLIEHDQQRVRKATISLTDRESTVGSQSFNSDVEEAAAIATLIALRTHVVPEAGVNLELNEVAVLARTNRIADNIATTLEAHRVPVRRRITAEAPEDWKLARAALRMLQARNNDAIVRYLRLVNPTAAALNERQAELGKLDLRKQFMSGLECTIGSVGRDLTRLRISRASIERIEKLLSDLPEPTTMGDLVLASVQNFEYEEQGDGVTCTTIHGAKGREWDTVIIAGFEEETIPGVRFLNVEEERRIAYVGITRARKTLRLTWVKARRETWGRRDYRETTPSRFLEEAGL
jgi:DNA helicase II / ATP-dependent DNA helicase PcrA